MSTTEVNQGPTEILKIQSITLGKFNNSEYLSFLMRTEDNIGGTPEAAAKLGIIAADYSDLKTGIETMSNIVNQSRISNETALLAEADKERDDLLVYILALIRNSKTVPLKEKRDAAINLYNVTKPYIGCNKVADKQETVQIYGLITDLSREDTAPDVTTLGLDDYLAGLAAANVKFENLTKQRTASQAAADLGDAKSVRVNLDVTYDRIVTMAFATSLIVPTAETALFVSNQNRIINETEVSYNQRMGQLKANKKPDTPVTPDNR